MTYLRNLFISGLIVFLPVFATIYFLALILRWADGWFAPLVYKYLPLPYIPGLSLMFTVIIILFTGLLAQNLIGQRLIEYGEMLIYRLPLTKGIYTTVKQMMEALIHPGQGGLKK